jgi:hypothetical protein
MPMTISVDKMTSKVLSSEGHSKEGGIFYKYIREKHGTNYFFVSFT